MKLSKTIFSMFSTILVSQAIYADQPICYASSDNVAVLYKINMPAIGASNLAYSTDINITGHNGFDGEGSAYRSSDNSVYLFEDDTGHMWKVDTLTGNATLVKANFFPNISAAEFYIDSNGEEKLYLIKKDRTIYRYNAITWALEAGPIAINNASGDGGGNKIAAGLAIHPTRGEAYIIDDVDDYTATTDPLDEATLYKVDLSTGDATERVCQLKKLAGEPHTLDAESLSFAQDGNLYTEDENHHPDRPERRLFKIDFENVVNGECSVSAVAILNAGNDDIEGLSCDGGNINPNNNQPPETQDINNSAILNTADATDIFDLNGTDVDGSVIKYIILSLPNVLHGTLLLNDNNVSVNQELSIAESKLLQFDPVAGNLDSASFTYMAVDDDNTTDTTPATFRIPMKDDSSPTPTATPTPTVIPIIFVQAPAGEETPLLEEDEADRVDFLSLVWNDTNQNGLQDNGESGLENILVTLYVSDCTTELNNTLSDVDGHYSFTNLEVDDYCVGVTLPSDYLVTLKDQKEDDTIDSDINVASLRSDTFMLNIENSTSANIDIGLYQERDQIKLENDSVVGNENGVTYVSILTNDDSNINISTLQFVTVNGEALGRSYRVEGEGLWEMDENGRVSFTPNADFHGTPSVVYYQSYSENGVALSNIAEIRISTPSCRCKDYETDSIPTFNMLSLIMMMLMTMLFASKTLNKEEK